MFPLLLSMKRVAYTEMFSLVTGVGFMQMCKRKLGTHLRGKKKREEMASVLRKMQAAHKSAE
jgi:large subunit ribosomal protein L36e